MDLITPEFAENTKPSQFCRHLILRYQNCMVLGWVTEATAEAIKIAFINNKKPEFNGMVSYKYWSLSYPDSPILIELEDRGTATWIRGEALVDMDHVIGITIEE